MSSQTALEIVLQRVQQKIQKLAEVETLLKDRIRLMREGTVPEDLTEVQEAAEQEI